MRLIYCVPINFFPSPQQKAILKSLRFVRFLIANQVFCFCHFAVDLNWQNFEITLLFTSVEFLFAASSVKFANILSARLDWIFLFSIVKSVKLIPISNHVSIEICRTAEAAAKEPTEMKIARRKSAKFSQNRYTFVWFFRIDWKR